MRDLSSERTVLECECGERLTILGSEEDWRSRRAVFECDGCGRKLALVDGRGSGDYRDDEGALAAS